jgi:Nuclease-related domain
MSSRILALRRADVCRACGCPLVAGTQAYWDAASRTVECMSCRAAPSAGASASVTSAGELDRGSAGASALREHERRRERRAARVRRRHPHIGRALLPLTRPPAHETSWKLGHRGELTVARTLERRTANGPTIILHDRRMPRGRGNIDHLAIAPTGVYAIDAKAARGKVRVRRPPFGEAKLIVAGRNRTHYADGLDCQVGAVRRALVTRGHAGVPVSGVLCFTVADLPLLGSAQIRGHRLHNCRALARKLNRSGPLSRREIHALAVELSEAFPPA